MTGAQEAESEGRSYRRLLKGDSTGLQIKSGATIRTIITLKLEARPLLEGSKWCFIGPKAKCTTCGKEFTTISNFKRLNYSTHSETQNYFNCTSCK